MIWHRVGCTTPYFTSISTAIGMFAIAATVGTLHLYYATATSAIVGAEWTWLAMQRYRAKPSPR